MNDQTRQTLDDRFSQNLLKFALAVLVLGPIVTLVALGPAVPDAPVNYLGPSMMLAVALLAWRLIARGKYSAAAHAMVYGVCAAITGIAMFTGGVRSPAVVVYPVLILVFGWLSNARAAIRVALLICLLTMLLWTAEILALLPPPAYAAPLIYAIHAIITYVLSTALLVFILKAYNRQLTELKKLGTDLAARTQLLEQNTNLLERAQTVANIGSWVADIAADRITPSSQGCQILGITSDDGITFQQYLSLLHTDDRPAVMLAWQLALKGGTFDGEHRVVVNGSTRWVRQKAELTKNAQGRAVSALGIVQDITERKLTQLALNESEKRYRNMIEWTPEATLVHRQTQILYANPAAVKLFGAPDAASLISKTTTELIHPDSLPMQLARMQLIQSGEPLPPKTEARFMRLDGVSIDVEVQGTAIEFDGAPAIQVSIHDITERKRMELEIRQLAFYDTLTGLPNRRLLSDRLAHAIASNRRNGCFGALMFLDLDNFKPLNDTHGHSVGDQLLVEAAQRIAGCLRQMDTVARFGGDEFVVLLTELETDHARSNQGASHVASKIRDALAKPYQLRAHSHMASNFELEHCCTVSIGVVVFAAANASEDDLTRCADTAMYQAKSEGRDRICFYAPAPV